MADEAGLDQIADELYGLRPDAFAAARDEQVSKARADGRAGLARELTRLRRPTQSAWLINLLWRDQRDVMEQLLQLTEQLSRAQAQASGPDLHRFTAQRREIEAALIRRARALAEQAGVNVSATMEREAQETLAAALAQPEVAAEVRTGRLVKPGAYAGFGPLTPMTTDAPAEKPRAAPPQAATKSKSEPRTAARDDGRDAESKRRVALERRVAEARMAVTEAAGALAKREREANAAHAVYEATDQRQDALRKQAEQLQQELDELRQQLDQVRQQQRDLKSEVAAADTAARSAARDRDQAEKAHAAAVRALEDSERQLNDL